MVEVLPTLLKLTVLIFSVTSMLSVGFSYTLREITEPLREIRRVFLALAANFVLIPVLAYVVSRLLSLEPAVMIGLLLAATAAGAPFLTTLTKIAEGDLAFAAGLLVLLLVVTIFYMPIVVPLIAPAAMVSALAIATPLVLTMLLPLGRTPHRLLVRAAYGSSTAHPDQGVQRCACRPGRDHCADELQALAFDVRHRGHPRSVACHRRRLRDGLFSRRPGSCGSKCSRACHGPAQYRGGDGGCDSELR